MPAGVRVPAAIRRALVRYAIEARPRECCGFLVGRGPDVIAAIAMANVAATPETRYQVDDADHVAIRRVLRRLTPPVEIVGVYHSHPGGDAAPSPTDVAEAYYPDWLQVIVGLGGRRPQVRAFRIAKGRVRPVRLI
jgi:proteasome lid subunit RPN8/RPN11